MTRLQLVVVLISATLVGVKGVDDWLDDTLELLLHFFNVFGFSGLAVLIEPFDGVLDGGVDLFLVFIRELGSKALLGVVVSDLVLESVSVLFELVLGSSSGSDLGVFLGEHLGVLDHSLDVLGRESVGVVFDLDLFFGTGALVFSRNSEDTVDIDLEGDLDLGNTSGCWWDAVEIELAEDVVVLGHWSFTFEDLDGDSLLVIGGGGEDLLFLGWDDRVSWDNLGHDTTDGLDTEGQWADIKEDDIDVVFTGENTSLDSGTESDSLIGVDTLGRFFAVEKFLDELLDLGDSSGATDKDDFVDFVLLHLTIIENLLDGLEGSSEKIVVEFFELGSGESLGEVLAIKEGFDFDSSRVSGRKSSLCLLNFSSELLDGSVVLSDVFSGLLLVELHEVVHDSLIEIFSSKMSVTVGSDDLEDSRIDGEKRDIEGSSSKIKDEDVLLAVLVLVHTVGDGGGSRFVDDSHDGHTGDDTGVLGGLSLGVREVGGDSDDGVSDGCSEVVFGDLLHLSENHGGNFFGCEGLVARASVDLDGGLGFALNDGEGEELLVGLDSGVGPGSADESLGIEDSVGWVGSKLVLGGVTDKSLTLGSEGNIRRSNSVTLIVGNNFDSASLEDTDAGVSCSQIDTDDGSDVLLLVVVGADGRGQKAQKEVKQFHFLA